MNQSHKVRQNYASTVKKAANLLCGFLLSAFTVRGISSPLAVAYVAAQLYANNGVFSAIGACFGYAVLFDGCEGGAYIGAVICLALGAFVFGESVLYRSKLAISLFSAALVGVLKSFGAVMGSQYDLIHGGQVLFPMLMTAVMAYLYSIGLSAGEEHADGVLRDLVLGAFGGTFFGGLLCMVGETAAELLYGGLGFAVLAFGLLLSEERSTIMSLGLMAVVGLCGEFDYIYAVPILCSAVLSRYLYRERQIVLVLFICMGIVSIALSVAVSDNQIYGIPMYLFMVGIYLVLPPYIYVRLFKQLPQWLFSSDLDQLPFFNSTVHGLAGMLSQLHVLLADKEESETTDYEGMAFAKAAVDEVCFACSHKGECTNQGYLNFEEIYRAVDLGIKEKGKVEEADIPSYCLEQCVCGKDMVCSINHKLARGFAEEVMNDLIYMDFMCAINELLDLSDITYGAAAANAVTEEAREYKHLLDFILMIYAQPFHGKVFQRSHGGVGIQLFAEDGDFSAVDEKYMAELSALMGLDLQSEPRCGTKNYLELYERPPLSVEVGLAQMRRQGEAACGDSAKAFVTKDGVFYAIIADGVGSGAEAEEDSRFAIELLENMLQQGVCAKHAMSLLQKLLFFHNPDLLKCVAVDLFAMSLHTGEAGLYKCGAADSYILSHNGVQIYGGKSLPAGMSAVRDHMVDEWGFQMKLGQLLVMTSDGVYIDNAFELKRQILETKENLKTLAKRILMNREECCRYDDMTVMVIGMREKKEIEKV